MFRYIRSSDYFPTTSRITSAQHNPGLNRYFFPAPILPFTSGTHLNHRTHFCCGSSSHVGHQHCTEAQECVSSRSEPPPPTAASGQAATGLREHSLKKILPWRSVPEQLQRVAEQRGPKEGHVHAQKVETSQYTGRELKYGANSGAIFEPPAAAAVAVAAAHAKFPNFVTDSNVLAAHGTHSRTWAVGSKVSPKEWAINNQQLYTGAESIHNNVSIIQSDVRQCIAQNSKVQIRCHVDTEHDLDKRISEVGDWTDKLKTELENNVRQFQKVGQYKEKVELVLQNLERPLEISRENLYQRESRQGVELVHDAVEESLFREVECFRRSKDELQGLSAQLTSQLSKLRASRHELEMDISNKQYAYGTDNTVRSLNELSKDIGSRSVVGCTCTTATCRHLESLEPFNSFSHSSPSSWLANTRAIIQKSVEERNLAHALCLATQESLAKIASECARLWGQCSSAFSTRIMEVEQAIKEMEGHLAKINFDIGQVHSQQVKMKKIIDEKKPALQLAQTRLEKRKERTGLELCRDKVTISLLQEIHALKNAIHELSSQYTNLNVIHEQLVLTKSKFEHELKLKKFAYRIDLEKCLGARRSFCMNKVFG